MRLCGRVTAIIAWSFALDLTALRIEKILNWGIIVIASPGSLQLYLVGKDPLWSDHCLVLDVTLAKSMDVRVCLLHSQHLIYSRGNAYTGISTTEAHSWRGVQRAESTNGNSRPHEASRSPYFCETWSTESGPGK